MVAQEKYRITRKLDAGGMAEVYEGVAEGIRGFRKKVAIKRVLPHLVENARFIAMFLDEARLSLHLSHANVVQVFDIGQAGGTYFIVMEYVNGTNLKNFLRLMKERGQVLPVAQAIFIAMEVCRGLAYAHQLRDPEGRPLRIVHRDVSPPNILLSREGEVKIVDFGLAKANSQLENTSPGVVKGKYAYLCPESATGRPVDHRMDVFCTGIVLWEMLTGRRLFLGANDIETIKKVREADVPYLPHINPAVSASLDAIIRKALAVDPDQRFQSCDALAEALAGCLFNERLKVTGFDLRRTLEAVLGGEDNRPSHSLIDQMIQEEISVFASLDVVSPGAKPLSAKTGNAPLRIEGFSGADQPSLTPWSARGDESEPTSLEKMLEGGHDDTWTRPEEEVSEADEAREVRMNFFAGLAVALAVVTVGVALAWVLGIIP